MIKTLSLYPLPLYTFPIKNDISKSITDNNIDRILFLTHYSCEVKQIKDTIRFIKISYIK